MEIAINNLLKIKPQSEEVAFAEIEEKAVSDQKFDQVYWSSLAFNALKFISRTYFRADYIDFGAYPERSSDDKPLVFVSNHAATAFPWDKLVFIGGMLRKYGADADKRLRLVLPPRYADKGLYNLFWIKDFWKKIGSIDESSANLAALFQSGESDFVLYPEGEKALSKSFKNRHQVLELETDFIELCIQHKTDIIPFATINGEYLQPLSFYLERANQILETVGLPVVPANLVTLLLPFQPWLYYFAMPAKLTYVMGERIKPYELALESSEDSIHYDINDIRDQVHEQMQASLINAMREYGKNAYKWRELLDSVRNNRVNWLYLLPIAWPLLIRLHRRKHLALIQQIEGLEVSADNTEYFEPDMMEHPQGSLKDQVIGLVTFVAKNPSTLLAYTPIAGWLEKRFKR